jgi:diacylglycerol kinase (ATP)
MNIEKNQPLVKRIGFAVAGLKQAIATERSLQTQIAIFVIVLVLLLVTRPAPIWWAIVALSVAAVIAAELFNTALERLADRLHPDIHPDIQFVKDCGAAAVLLLACGAAAVAIAFAIGQLT